MKQKKGLYNVTKKRSITTTIYRRNSKISKTIGLMFTSPLAVNNKAHVFSFNSEKKRSLHMFFVFYSIDVLFLDKKKQVIEKTQLLPFSVYVPKKKAQYIIELQKGKGKKVELGDILFFPEMRCKRSKNSK